jgi:hypothetical protein
MNFPSSPTEGQEYTFEGRTWVFNGIGWVLQGSERTDFATAAQGAKADSAVQPDDLGSAAAEDTTAFATAAQGSTADNALPASRVTISASSPTGGSDGDLWFKV